MRIPGSRRVLSKARRVPRWIGYQKGPTLMSRLRRARVLLRHPHANIQIHPSCYLGPGFSLHVPDGGTFIAGPDVEFRRNFRAEVAGNGRIVIGAGCYFTYNVLLACSTVLEIGERCGMALGTSVYDGSHNYRDLTKPFLDQGYRFRHIRIEDDVQIHALCTILDSIGTRTVLGANSVVTKPLPAYTLCVGAPA